MDQATSSVSTQSAEAVFDQFLERFDIDVPSEADEDRKSFGEARRVVLRALERGHLTLGGDGPAAVFRPQGGEAVSFKGPTGATRLAAGEGGDPVEKAILALAQLTGQRRQRFHEMEQRDLRVCEALLAIWFS